jgi:hypothetical protein
MDGMAIKCISFSIAPSLTLISSAFDFNHFLRRREKRQQTHSDREPAAASAREAALTVLTRSLLSIIDGDHRFSRVIGTGMASH